MDNQYAEEPLIKKVATKSGFYIYDTSSNQIIRVNRIEFDIFSEAIQGNVELLVEKYGDKYSSFALRRAINSIRNAKLALNLCSSRRPRISFGVGSPSDVRAILETNLKQIILELTESCNLRCAYCVYSGTYRYSRTHRAKDMAIDTLKKALSFFLPRASGRPNDGAAITFYGGEPLLKVELIKSTIDYIKARHSDANCRFSLTTNGTLLEDRTLDYFVDNKVSILVSLDGPKELHDRYRVYKNGRGTHDTIMDNLKRLKKRHPAYFNNNVSIAVTVAPPYDLPRIKQFLYSERTLEPIREKARISTVDTYETTFFDSFPVRELSRLDSMMSELYVKYTKALIDRTYERLTIEKELFDKRFLNIARRAQGPLSDLCFPRGTCFPGRRRLFVSAYGKYYMCERVGSNYEIGNIDEGFNYQRIYKFIREYELFFADCVNCWAQRLCSKCFNDIRRGDKFDKERKTQLCRAETEKIEHDLVTLCEIEDRKHDALRVLEKIVVA